MAAMPAKAGMLIAFACAPGTIAADTAPNGRNGMFTYHLLQNITRPGEDITLMLIDVTNGVFNDTKGKQIPYTTSALRQRGICLAPLEKKPTQTTEASARSSQSMFIPARQCDQAAAGPAAVPKNVMTQNQQLYPPPQYQQQYQPPPPPSPKHQAASTSDFHEPSQPAASPAAVPKNVIGQNQQQQYIPPPPPAPPSKHQAASTAGKFS
ncbi:unnamed protein product [Rotaria sp. Silwood1]|nr:unnamed protein product [Rotaria sp. Silwood1]